ncbi:MAG: dihydropteroate synthase [Rhodobiaceae bacterium]|nr:dihydropteroate synthase [Rhodobiaceae bacterium]
MSTGLYLHPVGLVAGAAAIELKALGAALALAGGPLAFTGAFVIEGRPGKARSRFVTASALAGIRDGDVAALVARVRAPRAPFAGIDMGAARLMGIVNLTPDSFSDGGRLADAAAGEAHGRALAAAGAEILDLGGESTRPGSEEVPLEEERARVMPVLTRLAGCGAVLSVDTRKAALMGEAAAAGAAIINDVSALTHEAPSAATVAAGGASVILMHMRGDPKTMQEAPAYLDVMLEVYDELADRLGAARAAGIGVGKLAVDPGIGFAKSFEHNLDVMRRLAMLHGLGVPLVVGASRKGFVGHFTGEREAARRVPGSVAMALAAAAQGAQILRVHDVAETSAALSAWQHATGIAEKAESAGMAGKQGATVRVAHNI